MDVDIIIRSVVSYMLSSSYPSSHPLLELMNQTSVDVAPDWARFEHAGLLPQGSTRLLALFTDVTSVKSVLTTRPETVSLIPVVLASIASDLHPAKFLLSILSEACRADSALWDLLAKKFHSTDLFTPFTLLLGRNNIDQCVSDKALQVLTSIVCHAGVSVLSPAQAQVLVGNIVAGRYKSSPAGSIEAIGNLLKLDLYRVGIMTTPGVVDKLFSANTPGAMYRSLLALWVASFNDEVLSTVLAKDHSKLSKYLKHVFDESRVEKVIRMALAVVRNVIASASIAESLVEDGIVHTIIPLEYEKWRDTDLYDEIKNVVSMITSETAKHSNFERYESELQSGNLNWGYIHTEKFWMENVKNFEKENFAPIATLITLLASANPVTQAVACHDLGEFARLHPSGKRIIAKLNGKDAIMGLMTNGSREVSKEALLCTQKIMLNQWQKLAPKVATK
jgi:V-type H+-transporting ATPase subunit H